MKVNQKSPIAKEFTSAVAEHSILKHKRIQADDWEVNVLAQNKGILSRKLEEARLICQRKPNLNREFGVKFLA